MNDNSIYMLWKIYQCQDILEEWPSIFILCIFLRWHSSALRHCLTAGADPIMISVIVTEWIKDNSWYPAKQCFLNQHVNQWCMLLYVCHVISNVLKLFDQYVIHDYDKNMRHEHEFLCDTKHYFYFKWN